MATSGIINGSQLGISNSGIPFDNNGRNCSTDSFIHCFRFGSERLQIFKKDAKKKKLKFMSKFVFFKLYYVILLLEHLNKNCLKKRHKTTIIN